MIKKIYSPRGMQVGYYDLVTRIYHTDRDWKKNQIFFNPKYKSGLGLSNSIIKEVIKIELHSSKEDDIDKILKIMKIRFRIFNFGSKVFFAEINIFDFLKNSIDVYFRGKENSDNQKVCPMHCCLRIYPDQKRLV